VTVIICVYNAGRFLLPAVESILAQTYTNLEIIIVDDGSTDGCMTTIAGLDDPRIRHFRQANAGKPAAMNLALGEMRGSFYALQDADDLSDPERIQRQLQCMAEHPDVAGVFTGYELLLDGRRVAPQSFFRSPERCRSDIDAFRMPSHDPTAMYRVSAVRDFRYDESLPIVEGLDYILRVGEQHPLMVCEGTLYSYRITRDSVTTRNPERRNHLAREALRRACVRRGIPVEAGPQLLRQPVKHSGSRDRDNHLAVHFIESVMHLRRANRRWDALATGLQCARLNPLDPHYFKALVYGLLPKATLRRHRPDLDWTDTSPRARELKSS